MSDYEWHSVNLAAKFIARELMGLVNVLVIKVFLNSRIISFFVFS